MLWGWYAQAKAHHLTHNSHSCPTAQVLEPCTESLYLSSMAESFDPVSIILDILMSNHDTYVVPLQDRKYQRAWAQ